MSSLCLMCFTLRFLYCVVKAPCEQKHFFLQLWLLYIIMASAMWSKYAVSLEATLEWKWIFVNFLNHKVSYGKEACCIAYTVCVVVEILTGSR